MHELLSLISYFLLIAIGIILVIIDNKINEIRNKLNNK